MSDAFAVVITTINDVTEFVKQYMNNAVFHRQIAQFIIVADKKTPVASFKTLAQLGPRVTVLTCALQEAWMMQHYPSLQQHLPWNTIARSNVGRLWAYAHGYGGILMLDDDNWPTAENFIEHHNIVGTERNNVTVQSDTGWFNVAQTLVETDGVEFYPRGFPPAHRWEAVLESQELVLKRVAVNAGLWLGDPDIDAITRLERPLRTTAYKASWSRTLALRPGTWSPWNSQNSAIWRDALVTYWMSPYAGRHLDIWASYISNLAIEHMGDVVTFGRPLVNHERVDHNLYKDLDDEAYWIEHTDNFITTLRTLEVTGKTYTETMRSIVDGLGDTQWAKDNKSYWLGLDAWVQVFEKKALPKYA